MTLRPLNIWTLLGLSLALLAPVLSSGQDTLAETAEGKAMASRLEAMLAATTTTTYQHKTEIDEADGRVRCDCSGLIGYVLRHDFPEAYLALKAESAPWRSRPLAATYHDTFQQAKPANEQAWIPVLKIMDARPGDVLAWRKTTLKRGSTTGHVLMIAGLPVREPDGRVRMRVLDSTSAPHANDTRAKGESGIGAGDMWFETDATGAATAFYVNATKPKSAIKQIRIGRLQDLDGKKAADHPDDKVFLGLGKKQAATLAVERKHTSRVIEEDGKVAPLTMRIIESRLNFVVENGVVVRVRRG